MFLTGQIVTAGRHTVSTFLQDLLVKDPEVPIALILQGPLRGTLRGQEIYFNKKIYPQQVRPVAG